MRALPEVNPRFRACDSPDESAGSLRAHGLRRWWPNGINRLSLRAANSRMARFSPGRGRVSDGSVFRSCRGSCRDASGYAAASHSDTQISPQLHDLPRRPRRATQYDFISAIVANSARRMRYGPCRPAGLQDRAARGSRTERSRTGDPFFATRVPARRRRPGRRPSRRPASRAARTEGSARESASRALQPDRGAPFERRGTSGAPRKRWIFPTM